MPKIGWEGENSLNHYGLIEKLVSHNNSFMEIAQVMLNKSKEHDIYQLIDRNFSVTLSVERKELIKLCLAERFNVLRSSLKS